MKTGANLLKFGEALKEEMSKVIADLPIGVGVHLVADQPVVVEHAVSGFTEALFEAVVIVLAISFFSLGLRAGLVVAIAIPLVLAITFVVMAVCGISLQRISLGALIIALGLLVDDAMIAVEMMVARLEVGDPLSKAATYVYTSTAFPMLTGTLVTVAGFIPIGLNSSNAGEYTFTLFVVIAVSLIVSWIVAVLFTPLLGVTILPAKMKGHHGGKGRIAGMFAHVLAVCMHHRWVTIGVTVAAFVAAPSGMQFVQQQFFPSSDRAELVIDWNLPQNASIATPTHRWLGSSVNNLREIIGSIIGRPMWEPARRGSFSRSICRLPTAGLVRWSSSPRAASRSVTGSRTSSKAICGRLFQAPIRTSNCLRLGPRSGARCNTGSAARTSQR